MSCSPIEFDAANDKERCKCRAAVLRAYNGMIKTGAPQNFAMDAARILYSYHHPEDQLIDAALTVERWVCSQAGAFH